MTKFTPEENEEILYERWLLNDGPGKAMRENIRLAEDSRDRLREGGWVFLSTDMVKESGTDYPVLECVVRQYNVVKLIRWKPFNKDWMVKGEYGWTIFNG